MIKSLTWPLNVKKDVFDVPAKKFDNGLVEVPEANSLKAISPAISNVSPGALFPIPTKPFV